MFILDVPGVNGGPAPAVAQFIAQHRNTLLQGQLQRQQNQEIFANAIGAIRGIRRPIMNAVPLQSPRPTNIPILGVRGSGFNAAVDPTLTGGTSSGPAEDRSVATTLGIGMGLNTPGTAYSDDQRRNASMGINLEYLQQLHNR